jgi:hypothetical protein
MTLITTQYGRFTAPGLAPRHPDKFTQVYGSKLRAAEKTSIMARVTELSMAVLELRHVFD